MITLFRPYEEIIRNPHKSSKVQIISNSGSDIKVPISIKILNFNRFCFNKVAFALHSFQIRKRGNPIILFKPIINFIMFILNTAFPNRQSQKLFHPRPRLEISKSIHHITVKKQKSRRKKLFHYIPLRIIALPRLFPLLKPIIHHNLLSLNKQKHNLISNIIDIPHQNLVLIHCFYIPNVYSKHLINSILIMHLMYHMVMEPHKEKLSTFISLTVFLPPQYIIRLNFSHSIHIIIHRPRVISQIL